MNTELVKYVVLVPNRIDGRFGEIVTEQEGNRRHGEDILNPDDSRWGSWTVLTIPLSKAEAIAALDEYLAVFTDSGE
jgi:hypothetical protein